MMLSIAWSVECASSWWSLRVIVPQVVVIYILMSMGRYEIDKTTYLWEMTREEVVRSRRRTRDCLVEFEIYLLLW